MNARPLNLRRAGRGRAERSFGIIRPAPLLIPLYAAAGHARPRRKEIIFGTTGIKAKQWTAQSSQVAHCIPAEIQENHSLISSAVAGRRADGPGLSNGKAILSDDIVTVKAREPLGPRRAPDPFGRD
jgi:hypothetical protein